VCINNEKKKVENEEVEKYIEKIDDYMEKLDEITNDKFLPGKIKYNVINLIEKKNIITKKQNTKKKFKSFFQKRIGRRIE